MGGSSAKNGPEVIGLEVMSNSTNALPFDYFSIDDKGIVAMGQDGYPGGTFWIHYDDGTTHAFPEHAVRMVVLK